MTTKATTVRIDKKTLNRIDKICDQWPGKCRNTYINGAIELALDGRSANLPEINENDEVINEEINDFDESKPLDNSDKPVKVVEI